MGWNHQIETYCSHDRWETDFPFCLDDDMDLFWGYAPPKTKTEQFLVCFSLSKDVFSGSKC